MRVLLRAPSALRLMGASSVWPFSALGGVTLVSVPEVITPIRSDNSSNSSRSSEMSSTRPCV